MMRGGEGREEEGEGERGEERRRGKKGEKREGRIISLD